MKVLTRFLLTRFLLRGEKHLGKIGENSAGGNREW